MASTNNVSELIAELETAFKEAGIPLPPEDIIHSPSETHLITLLHILQRGDSHWIEKALAKVQEPDTRKSLIRMALIHKLEKGLPPAPAIIQAQLEHLQRQPLSPVILDPHKNPPAMAWLIPNWLPRGRAGILTGSGGVGKSMLTLQLAMGLGAGVQHWMPRGKEYYPGYKSLWLTDKTPRCTLMVSWEEDVDNIWRRARAKRNAMIKKIAAMNNWAPKIQHKKRWEESLQYVPIISMEDRGPLWAPATTGSGHTSTMGELTETGRELRSVAEKRDIDLLVIDPLASAFSCNENDRGLVRAFMASWDTWARQTNCTVLIIAHPPKGDADYSGSTDWHGASRFMWTLKKKEEDKCIELALIKSNYGPLPDLPVRFSLQTWPLFVVRDEFIMTDASKIKGPHPFK